MTPAEEKPRAGRPPGPAEARRTSHIKVMTTDAEYAELEQAAKAAEKPVSTWLREVGIEKARGKKKK